MFTVVIEFKVGSKKMVFGLNKVQAEKVCSNWDKNPNVSYTGIIDERN